jgi:hexosaminidase
MYINFPSEETGLPRESRSAEGERHAEHVSDEDNRVLTEPAKRLSDEDQVLDLLQPAKGLSRTDKPKVLHKVDPGLIGVWPVPQQVFASEPLESPVTVSAELQFLAESEGKDLKTLIQHYRGVYLEARANSKLDSSCGSSLFTIKSLAVTIYGRDDVLSLETDYSYALTIDASKSVQVTIVAATVYGVRYGLETFLQLFNGQCLRYSNLRIKDRPDYRHRGFMLDTGRRFVPKTLLLNFLDAMSMVKLNVFHWHLSDWCLFSIESKL